MSEQLQLETANSAGTSHHKVFHQFPCWQGRVPDGFIMNFLGVMTRAHYWRPYIAVSEGYPADRYVNTEYPPFDEEYFEWIDLLETIIAAEDQFTMLEIGAGWGRWTANAAAALKHFVCPSPTFIAVEAEPTHFKWMVQHLADNSVDSKNLRLIQAAVARTDGKVGFYVGETQGRGPSNYYGHSIGGPHAVDAVSLSTLLRPLTTVNLVDLDIQGVELEVLEAAAQELDEKVNRVHVGTHSRKIEEGLRSLFRRLGWRCLRCFPSNASVNTECGTISFQDGVQTWLNPTYSHQRTNAVAILTEKLATSRQEGARLWAELESVRRDRGREHAPKVGSVASRIIEKGGRLRDRVAPLGTRRRMAFDSIAKKI
jgi:FkbM family methyltransferase